MDWKLFFSTFSLIFVAELPDKTALATLMMATRGSPWPIFIGVALAFVVQTVIAVLFGHAFAHLPEKWVHLAAGTLFLVFAAVSWRRKEEEEEETDERIIEKECDSTAPFTRAVWSAFLVIFIAEWGDLTQLATASLTARFHEPLTIFLAAVVALWSVTALATFAGHRLKRIVHPQILQRIAALAFAAVGTYFLVRWFQDSVTLGR